MASKIRSKKDPWIIVEHVFILVGVLLLGSPLLALIINGVIYGLSSSITMENVLPSQRLVELLIRSVALASWSGVLTVGVGFFIALFIWRYSSFPIKFVLGLLMFLFLIPSFIHAQSWIFFMDYLNGFLGYNFSGFYASLLVFFMTYLPSSIGFALVGLYSIDSDLIDTGVVYGSSFYTLKHVLIPLCSPLLIMSFNLIFILCLTDFAIPSLFAINVYPLHIFSQFSADQSVGQAFLTSLPLLLITSIVVFSSFSVIKQFSFDYTIVDVNIRNKNSLFRSSVLKGGLFLAAVIWGFQMVIPLSLLLMEAQDFTVVTQSMNELFYSLSIATGATLICLPIGFAIGNVIVEHKKALKWWWFFLSMVFIMPAPLIGIGMIAFWQRLPIGLYGTLAMPIMAGVIRFLPISALVCYIQLKSLDQDILDAAKVFMPNKAARYWYVLFPMCSKGIIISSGMIFALTVSELGATLMVSPPGMNTLIMKIYNYLHFGASNTVATLCLLLLCIILIIGIVIWAVFAQTNGNKQERKVMP